MSIISSLYGHLPGLGTLVENYEAAFCWGPYPRYYTPAYIGSTAADPGNSPTWELRMGLVMGKVTATGQWVNYSATATDGSQIAQGVLPIGLRMQDIITGSNTQKFYAIMVSGGVQGSKLIGLDNMARAQMAKTFIFDDNFPGNSDFPFLQFQTKTANYQITAADNFTLFDNSGAGGDITLTLPAIANGYYFGVRDFNTHKILVQSSEGSNLIGTTLTQSSASVTAVGGGFVVYSNALATQWNVSNISSYTQVVSFL